MKRHCDFHIGGLVLVLFASGLVLASCGQRSVDQTAAAKGQVVARVGSEVITTQELDNEFRLANIGPDKQKDPDLLKRVLSDIVVRKYLLQQAMAEKLDREPGVLLDLLRAREQVLGSATIARAAFAKVPTKADLDRYVAKNPWKFADRKLFSADEIVVPLTPVTQSFVNMGKDAKSLDEIQQRLAEAAIPYSRQMGTIMSSDLSEDLAVSVQEQKNEIFFTRVGSNGLFFKVKSGEARPLEGDAALNSARQTMRADAIGAELGLATYSAKLEAKYEGDYAALMKQDDVNPQ